MPTAIDGIRKLGRRGHVVVAADTFNEAPGIHSRYVSRAEIVASPRYKPEAFVDDVARIVRDQAIDLVLPCFEEAIYLARQVDRLPTSAKYFFPSFETLEALHDKQRIVEIARDIGVRAPQSVVVTSLEELEYATSQLDEYFAKPVYSRGGVFALTNRGPLAKARDRASCKPSVLEPWVVEEYIDGPDVCTFSIAHRGRISAHVTYVHPREIEHAGGTVFESIDDPVALDSVRRFVEWSGYDGQISFDFRRAKNGLHVIECNPRPTAGIHLFDDKLFVDALLEPRSGDPYVLPAGARSKYSFALLRNMVLHGDDMVADLRHLFSKSAEAILIPDDPWPAAYQVISLNVVRAYRQRQAKARSTDVMAAYFDDISWNGQIAARQAA